MWLLHTKTLRLREFSGDLPGWAPGKQTGQVIPHYAILSHCWRKGEVLFQDIQDLDHAREMAGFSKIEYCCKQALKIGYKWTWVDTCCVDKSSSAELSETINSMFKWYGHSGTCLVYLDDVDDGDPHIRDSLFRKSRWFTRGWTLQELIAPKRVIFFSKFWSFLGTKGSLLALPSDITKIPLDALSQSSSFSSYSVAQRMSWAAKRETTRIEDRAYSLMGLFNIFMPIIYGEGSSAFRRLQLQIIQHSNDQSIFAWTSKWSTPYPLPLAEHWIETETNDSGSFPIVELPSHFQIEYSSIIASSPTDFLYSSNIVPLPVSAIVKPREEPPGSMSEYSWTHLGLHIRMPLIPVRIRVKKVRPFIGMLSCWDSVEQSVCGIVLFRNSAQDPYRCYNLGIFGSGVSDSSNHLVSIPKENYDEVLPKLAVSRDIYVTNQHDPGHDSASDSAIGRDSPSSGDRGLSQVQLLVVFPSYTLKILEQMGFSLAGHASQHGLGSSQDRQVWKDPGGDLLLEFQLPPPEADDPHRYSHCPTTHINLLFLNRATNQAFSVFVGHSRYSLLSYFYPRVSIDVAFYRPEEFSTLDAQSLCDGCDHHDYHSHFRLPFDVRAYPESIDDSWKRYKRDDADNSPGLVRHCECTCDQGREGTTTMTFGDYKRGLSVTTSVWNENDVEEKCAYCTVWVEMSLSGHIYSGPDDCDDERDARSDAAECGSDQSDSEAEDEDELELELDSVLLRLVKA